MAVHLAHVVECWHPTSVSWVQCPMWDGYGRRVGQGGFPKLPMHIWVFLRQYRPHISFKDKSTQTVPQCKLYG